MALSAWGQVFHVLRFVLGTALSAYAFILEKACSWAVAFLQFIPAHIYILYFGGAFLLGRLIVTAKSSDGPRWVPGMVICLGAMLLAFLIPVAPYLLAVAGC